MLKMTAIVQFLLALALFSVASTEQLKVLCYYESWSGNYSPDEIDVNICTHVYYSFMGINADDGTLRLDSSDAQIKQLVGLKSKNPNLKVLLSVGGWGEDPTRFSAVAADAAKKAKMAESTLSYLQKYDLDGLDVDWEYPGYRGGTAVDKENFVDMLWTLRNAFNANGGYLLTIAVPFFTDDDSYDIPAIYEVVDYINLMTYDIHHPTDGKTGQNSPLYVSSSDTAVDKAAASCNASVVNWIAKGAGVEKLTLGLGFYGKAYKLADPNVNSVNSASVGESSAGSGSYPQICQLVDGWTEVWDDEQKNPYKYKGTDWIGYDDVRSIGLKVQYANEKNMGGVMMWAVDLDDKNGVCGGKKNALMNAIKDNL